MKLFHLSCSVLSAAFLLASPGFAHEHSQKSDCINRLIELGLDGWAKYLLTYAPELVDEIGKRNDITIWAPGNEAVRRSLQSSKLTKRGGSQNSKINTSKDYNTKTGSTSGLSRRDSEIKKRTIDHTSRSYPDTNFVKVYTFLDDPEYINLGENEDLRLVRNYATPSDGKFDSPALTEVTTGLGHVKNTLRGPFKCKNGVIYEVSDIFSVPEAFSTTLEYLKISNQFYKSVVQTGNFDLFEKAPAVTIFAPVDAFGKIHVDPKSHILWEKDGFSLYFTPDLFPGTTLTSASGAPIKITRSSTGETLVNGRRIVKPNIVTKNGVIHFIDGPLDESKKHYRRSD